MQKRIILILMALIMVLGCAVGCDFNSAGDETTELEGEINIPAYDPILGKNVSTYTIIRPEIVPDTVLSEVVSFNNKMKLVFGDSIQFKDDFYREGVEMFEMGEYEILIGATNRPETLEFLNTLEPNDYGYGLVNKKIVITGWTNDGTIKAIKHFMSNVLLKYQKDYSFADDEVFFSSDNNYNYRSFYEYDGFTINGIPAGDFRIVYPADSDMGEAEFSVNLANSFERGCGFALDVVSDDMPRGDKIKHEILVGKTNRNTDDEYAAICEGIAENEGVIVFNGTDINVGANSLATFKITIDDFIAKLPSSSDTVDVLFEEKLVCDYNDDSIFAMTFNVQVWFTEGTGGTTNRIKRVRETIKTYMPDVIGFQEVHGYWQNLLVSSFGSYYGYTGLPRDGLKDGERNMIFYNKERFNLIDSGTKWHSETPDVISQHPDAAASECLVYVILERKSDGKRFVHVNCHLDWTNGDVRTYQTEKMLEYIDEHFKEYPIIWTGDFNYGTTSVGYNKILAAGYGASSAIAEDIIEAGPTFTSYGESAAYLDHIFVTPQTVFVKSYKVCKDKFDGWYPSDHHPVLIEFSLLN